MLPLITIGLDLKCFWMKHWTYYDLECPEKVVLLSGYRSSFAQIAQMI